MSAADTGLLCQLPLLWNKPGQVQFMYNKGHNILPLQPMNKVCKVEW